MLSKKNVVILDGGLTKDPEVFENTGVVHLSVGVDGAGSEKGVQNPSGYFDVKVWLNQSKYTAAATAENIRAALADKSLAKGTRVGIVGRLTHERWTDKEGKKSARVIITAETIDIYRAKGQSSAPAGSVAQAASASASSSIDEF
jgi:single-stranded DNA-binding protein